MPRLEIARPCLLAAALMISANAGAGSANWQQSVSFDVQLSVRNPGAAGYVAVFAVSSPDGRVFRKEVDVAGDAFGSVRFPTDFATDFHPGVYRWSAVVAGKEVTAGRFSWRPTKLGQRLSEPN